MEVAFNQVERDRERDGRLQINSVSFEGLLLSPTMDSYYIAMEPSNLMVVLCHSHSTYYWYRQEWGTLLHIDIYASNASGAPIQSKATQVRFSWFYKKR